MVVKDSVRAKLLPHETVRFGQFLNRFGQVDFREKRFDQFPPPFGMSIDNVQQILKCCDF